MSRTVLASEYWSLEVNYREVLGEGKGGVLQAPGFNNVMWDSIGIPFVPCGPLLPPLKHFKSNSNTGANT